MRVFVAGATGVLGRRIVRQLVARGHEAVGLVRDPHGEKSIVALGGLPRRADLFDPDSLARAAEGSDVVVHAATSIPTKVRTKTRDWTMNDRIRREGTRALTEAAARVRARAYVQQSVVWAVRRPGGGPFDESAPSAGDPGLASALDGERIAHEGGASNGFRAVVLRCGLFYSADSWHTRVYGDSLVRGRPVLVGRGDAVWSFLHADDAARAFVSACERPRDGVWHVVDDRPASLAEYLSALAAELGARPPRGVPRWVARLVLGRSATALLTMSFRTSNARFREDYGWTPIFPTYGEGLKDVVGTWKESGFPLRRTA